MDEQSVGAYWSQASSDLIRQLGTSPQGLTMAEARGRLLVFGPNALSMQEKTSAPGLFLNQFKSPIVIILLFATMVSAITREWVDALIILLIVLGSAVLSFLQEYHASTATAKLRNRVTVRTTVLRDGLPQSISSEEVVPGDVVLLSAGALVPADGVLLETKDFYVNQAVLTGETFPVEKRVGQVAASAGLVERLNSVFMGTNVRSGSGKALIVQTGKGTSFGQIAERLNLRPPETEFERGVRRFGYLLSEVMLVLVLIVFAVNVFFNKPVLDSLLFSIALAVGLTPQLLPAIVSLNLSKGAQKMATEGVIVRRLESIENLGSMDVLCTDKTGTLTEGLVRLDAALDFDGQPSDEVFRYAYLNAYFQTGLSNPLDEAIMAQAQIDVSQIAKVDEVPYDFVRKRLSVVVREGDRCQLITKGALDSVLDACTRGQIGGDDVALDENRRERTGERFAGWSEKGYRVLGLAIKAMAPQRAVTRDDERDMVFVGFLLFFDPPKRGAQKAIADLAASGVQLKIISGDNHLVALHVAEAIGLQVTGMLSGAELADLHDEALWQRAERTNLFAEVDPNQKERIILALKKMGHVVGYMGDGINDAPALHAADVGISVDKAVDVAREAADFVLLEQDLGVLSKGVVLGRTTFANTLKYVFITTSANFGNMFSMAGASLFLPFLPMLPLQILLTNFLTDFPAITIAGDTVDPELIEFPRRWDVKFIRSFMMTFGTISSVFDYLTFGVLLLILHAGIQEFRTAWFLESVLTELLILIVVRTRRPFLKSAPSKSLLAACLLVAGMTIILPYSPLRNLLGFTPIPVALLLAIIGITLLYVTASELAKKTFYSKVRS